MISPGRFPHTIGRPRGVSGGAGAPPRGAPAAGQEPPNPGAILRDPSGSRPETPLSRLADGDSDPQGSPRSAIEEGVQVPGGTRFELTPTGWAELRRIRLSSEWIHATRAATLIRQSLEDNERELDERRGVFSRHAREIAAELDGKEPPRDRRDRREGDAALEDELERPGRRDP